MSKTVDEILAHIPAGAYRQEGKFRPKLDFAQRCEILALYRRGVGRNVLADAFGIDRRTVTHIQNQNSVHYKSVRDRYAELGKEVFEREYITEAGSLKVAEQLGKQPKADPTKPNRNAGRHAGINIVDGTYCERPHRVDVQWLADGAAGPGWYYQDLDGPAPELWTYTNETSLLTSTNCLRALKDEISDA